MQFTSAPLKAVTLAVCTIFISACSSNTPVSTSHGFDQASVPDVLEALQDDSVTVIDARNPDAFNGWVFEKGNLNLDKTGGHIPGAELFSARWIKHDLEKEDMDRGYEYAGLEQADEIIIYGYTEKQASTVAQWLVDEKGWKDDSISILEGGIASWIEQKPQSLEYLPGFRTLVPPQYVEQVTKEHPDIKVIEIGWDGGKGEVYRKAHIPGAIYWDDMEFEYPPIYEAYPVETIRTSLEKLGIDKDSSIIVYSTDSIGSGRGAAIMKYAGVEDVVMMNGTTSLWQAENLTIESGWNQPVAIDDFGITGPGDNSVIIDIDEARELRKQANSALVSIRSWKEYIGEVSGYNYFQKRGRIPGAIWGHAGTSSWNMDHYHNPDNTMRNYHQIAGFWKEWNITSDMNLSFYCGNGWRASEVWWYAQAMGYKNSTVYSSGWMRWREDENPIKSGEVTIKQALAEWQAVSGA